MKYKFTISPFRVDEKTYESLETFRADASRKLGKIIPFGDVMRWALDAYAEDTSVEAPLNPYGRLTKTIPSFRTTRLQRRLLDKRSSETMRPIAQILRDALFALLQKAQEEKEGEPQ